VKRSPYLFLVVVVVVAGLVAAAGPFLAGAGSGRPVAVGAVMAALAQCALFVLLVQAFPGRGMLVFGMGMMGHLVLLVLAMFVVVPLSGLAAAPTLISLVSVLFASTVVEPLFLSVDNRKNA
jgi:hypothetical protein